jgi:uncharacterized protein (TIGR04255 family)
MLNTVALRLKDPPLVEVVCGFFFPPLDLDPIIVGKYWADKKEAQGYGHHQVHAAVSDRPGLALSDNMGPLRCWLINDADDFVIQIQPDRFYFNWRKRKSVYPHFTDRDGIDGVRTKSIREFEEFRAFCSSNLKESPTATRLELTKVDLLTNPQHWQNYTDLQSVLPILGKLPQIANEPSLNMSLEGQRDNFQVQFTLTNVVLAEDMSPAVKIETRVNAVATPNMGTTLSAMNETANQIFFDTLNVDELSRFGGILE